MFGVNLWLLKDIKKEIENNKPTENPATAEFLQTMREQMQAAQQEQKPVNPEDITAAMLNMVGQALTLD